MSSKLKFGCCNVENEAEPEAAMPAGWQATGPVKLCKVLAENRKRRVGVSQNNENQEAARPSGQLPEIWIAEESCSNTRGYVHTLPYTGVMSAGGMRPRFVEELIIPSLCKDLGKAEFILLPHRAGVVRPAGATSEPPAAGLQPHVPAEPLLWDTWEAENHSGSMLQWQPLHLWIIILLNTSICLHKYTRIYEAGLHPVSVGLSCIFLHLLKHIPMHPRSSLSLPQLSRMGGLLKKNNVGKEH